MNSPFPKHALRILLLLLCLGQVKNASGNGSERLILLGDAAYSRKAFDSAITYYGQAASDKSADATALYKLGNAHYRLKHTGEAVLAYERALAKEPGFTAAAKNVELIQQQIMPAGQEVFFIRWWRAITAPELSNLWAILAIIIFAALLSTITWNHYKQRRPAWQRPQLIVAALTLAVVFVVFGLAGARRDMPQAAAVVMQRDTKFRSLSGSAKSGGISLPEGLLVKVLNAKSEQIIVQLPDGQKGLVQRSDIATVE